MTRYLDKTSIYRITSCPIIKTANSMFRYMDFSKTRHFVCLLRQMTNLDKTSIYRIISCPVIDTLLYFDNRMSRYQDKMSVRFDCITRTCRTSLCYFYRVDITVMYLRLKNRSPNTVKLSSCSTNIKIGAKLKDKNSCTSQGL